MVIFESDEYALPGWDMLSAHKDRLWTLKQCKKYITGSHIARLWYCDDMDAIRGWVAHWEFCMIACAILQFALWYTPGKSLSIKLMTHLLTKGIFWGAIIFQGGNLLHP
jgi:hypothetical protein